MSELTPKIHDEANGLDYVLTGDYCIPAIELPEEDDRPIGKWGRMHRTYLEETNPLLLNHLILRIFRMTLTQKRLLILLVIVSDGELRETQTANYFSNLYPIDCAMPSVNA